MRALLQRYNQPVVKPAEIISTLLTLVFPDAMTALDLTPGRGNFWDGRAFIELTNSTHDFRHLPYTDGEFDVVLFDPPHNADQGRDSVMKSFGTYSSKDLPNVIRQGCCEASRVAKIGTIIKVTDQVHGQVFVRESGWVYDVLGEPYEVVVGTHYQVEDPKWKMPAISARSNGSLYICHRHGSQKHVRRGAPPPPVLV